MFAGELKARQAKLEREVKERSEAERRRREKEKALAEQQAARQRAREEEARERRLAVLAAEEAERERIEAETEHNRGVYYRAHLQAAPTSAASAAARGIRRAADKLLLPASVGAMLMAQEAFKNGAMLFEVTASNGARTHAGVLEFSSEVPEGVVLLPDKVQDCLWGLAEPTTATRQPTAPSDTADATSGPGPGSAGSSGGGSSARCSGRVHVAYKRLEKGTYVRLQPELRAFHEAFEGAEGEGMKGALEDALHAVCTLTEGDWVRVPFNGVTYNLRVLELQPASAVSVIDTDIACDVGPSIETEGYLRAREEEAAREAERLRQLEEDRAAAAAAALAAAEAALAADAARTAEESARRLRVKAEAAESLPAEPAAAEPHAACVFRLPDGGRAARRFRPSDPVKALFDFVDSQGGGGLWPGEYRLVSSYPRRVIAPPGGGAVDGTNAGGDGGVTLAAAGLTAGQQLALMLEPIS